MNLWEDLYVMCLLIANGAKVSYVSKVLYHYDAIVNENSIVKHLQESHIQSNIIFVDDLFPILSDHKYCDGWFHIKSNIKDKIFRTKNCRFDIKETYKEINERYIEEARTMPLSSRKRCVAICLQTNSLIGHFVYSSMRWLKRIGH